MENSGKILDRLNWLQRYLAEEYVEDYQEGALTRRDALKYLGAVLGTAGAAALLTACDAPAATGLETPAPPAGAVALNTASPLKPAEMGSVTPHPTPEEIRSTATAAVLATADTSATAAPTPGPTATSAGVNVPADDPGLESSDITFPGKGLDVLGYLARPKQDGRLPAILVCHENRGLTEHIRDVTRRVAKAGYVGLAVDLLSARGGFGKVTDPEEIPGILSSTPPDELAGYFLSAIQYLEAQPFVYPDQLGMVGFCFGGGMTWLVATKAPQLKAAVPFYGPNPPLDAVPNIRAAVLAIYGENDQRINAGIPAIEEAMRKNGKVFEKVIYPGANHAFHNDTGRNYNPDAAVDAWKRTLAWFAKYVKGDRA